MIGFIGLGIMGSRMAKNLLQGGFDLIIFNRTKEKAGELLQKGAAWADSPREVAEKSDVIFTMLANPEAVEAAALNEAGFLNHLQAGKLWVDCSTVDPMFTRKMAEEAANRKIRFLDAPVAGSRGPAEQGELIFLVGGEKRDLDEIKSMLEVMGKEISYQGGVSKGTSMKLIINLMLAQSMAAFSEAVRLGESIGLNKEHVINTLLNGPTAAPFLKGKKEKILESDYEADFPLEHMHKDMQLASVTAYECHLSLPIANITKEMYAMASQQGFGKEDFSAIYRLWEQRG